MKTILKLALILALTLPALAAEPFNPAELSRGEAVKMVTNAIKAEQQKVVTALIGLASLRDVEVVMDEAEAEMVALRLALQQPPPTAEEIGVAREKAKQTILITAARHEEKITECLEKIGLIRAARDSHRIIAE